MAINIVQLQYKPAVRLSSLHARRTQSHTLRLWKVWPCTGDRALALTTASLRGTTRGIAGQWRVYILKCGSDPPNAGHLRAMHNLYSLYCRHRANCKCSPRNWSRSCWLSWRDEMDAPSRQESYIKWKAGQVYTNNSDNKGIRDG